MLDHSASVVKYVFVNRYFHPDQSATSQMLTDLAEGLSARGYRVHVVCSRQLYADPRKRLPATQTHSGICVHRVATTRFGRDRLLGRAVDYASFYISSTFALLLLLRTDDVLIMKTDPPLMSILGACIARVRRAFLVNWQQDVFPEVASRLNANPWPRWVEELLRRRRDASLRAARMNVVIGSRMLEYFANRGIPREQLCVIDNWADSSAIVPKPAADSTLRRRLGLEGKFVACYSGNLGRAHEFETMLAAAQILRAEPAFVFLIIGGGANMEPLRRAVAERQLDNFVFLPYQPREELADSLAGADVHLASLLPALEGLIVPSKLYGILAAGRPLIFIGEADGDTGRIILRAGCGIVVGVDAANELATVLRQIQADPAGGASMGLRARELFMAQYRLDIAIDKWIAVLAPGTAPS